MPATDLWTAAEKFADELTKHLPGLKERKTQIDKDVSNAEQAMGRYDSYIMNAKHDNGTYRCRSAGSVLA
jgi:hypothetical protein